MGAWKEVSVAADIDIFFCDPHAPWQRGTNENTNGLLRQYFPKGTDLSVHSAVDLDWVATELNDRPRKRLGFAKPIAGAGDDVVLVGHSTGGLRVLDLVRSESGRLDHGSARLSRRLEARIPRRRIFRADSRRTLA
jgi:hypothetical protein